MLYRRLADWTEIGQKFILIVEQSSVAVCQCQKNAMRPFVLLFVAL